ncbi:hypothetical protein QVD17_09579 [Tagetes erecta]|uniref:Uncharacterized protein n=1 Tax=Tagetes erecta TaxID=13708 RepID=A0AAD8L4X6_TARER|nr:hypothetical protein QVD17_09579 [Tagetes erecta]
MIKLWDSLCVIAKVTDYVNYLFVVIKLCWSWLYLYFVLFCVPHPTWEFGKLSSHILNQTSLDSHASLFRSDHSSLFRSDVLHSDAATKRSYV